MTQSAKPSGAIGALNRALEAAFGNQNRPDPDSAGFEGLVGPLLSAMGWKGSQRMVLEAAPYLERVHNGDELRAMLLRLGVATPGSKIALRELSTAQLPCLVVSPDLATAYVLLELLDGARARALSSSDGPGKVTEVDLHRLSGTLFLPALIDIEKEKSALARLGWLSSILLKLKGSILQLLLITSIINAVNLLLTLYAMVVFDKAIGSKSLDTLAMLFLGATLAFTFVLWLQRLRARAVATLSVRTDMAIQIATCRAVVGLPLNLTESSPIGVQLGRFQQFEIARDLFGGQLAGAIFELPFLVVFLAMIFVLGGPLGFLPLAAAFLIVVFAALANRRILNASREGSELHSRAETLLTEFAGRVRTIRDDGAENIFRQRASEAYRSYLLMKFRSKRLESQLLTVSTVIGTLTTAAVLGLGALRIIDKTMSVGALMAIMLVIGRVLSPISIVSLSQQRLRDLMQTMAQINMLMRMHFEGMKPPSVTERPIRGALQIRGLAFKYGGAGEIALRNVSLDVPAGQFIAVTGQSGAGKSTLLKLLLGLYTPLTGQIRIDGHDIRQLDSTQLRQSVGFINQQTDVFYGSLASNVRMAAPGMSDARIITMLEKFGISLPHQLLPDGINTHLRSGLGDRTSPAFLQRVALVRALGEERPILLLDEPAQHIDAECDEALMQYLESLKGRVTIIMVTPRPSHMRRADRVIVLSGGNVAADGPPSDIVPKIMSEISRPLVQPVAVKQDTVALRV